MSKITVLFIKASLIYLALGAILGVWMTIPNVNYGMFRPSHAHLMVLGFCSMMIFGVAYHILPRFSGKQLFSDKMADWNFYLANVGLIAMTVGFAHITAPAMGILLLLGSVIEAVACFLFVVNMFKTLPEKGL
ncbi:MAG: cbb3-type cytochrome c oxidase subunit I [Nitrospirota bacterium]|nr:cbb3-type cytochrome c oxidase subunit I [Nitrospirota bacterium]